MFFYLAGRYSRREELCEYRTELEKAGHIVTSRWLNGAHQLDDQGIPLNEERERLFHAGDPRVDGLRWKFANDDFSDVMTADVLVAFTEEPRSVKTRGGRHVEMGIALGAQKQVVVIGPQENVFCWLPQVERFRGWREFIEDWRRWSYVT